MRLHYRSIDDAGKPVRLRWLWLPPVDHRPMLTSWAGRLLRHPPEVLLPAGIFVGATVALLALAAMQGPWVLAVTLLSPIASTLIFAVIALSLWQVAAVRRHASRTRAALLRQQTCPGCLYELTGAEQHQGLTACPECGARWDLHAATSRRVIVVGK